MPAGRPRGHREALLEGAIQCIQEKGYARTTARDLVAASGTNLGSIGYHFGSKEKLLNEAIAEAFNRWLVHLAIAAVTDVDASPLERLRRSLSAWSETLEQNRPFLVAFVEALAQSAHSEELRAQLAAMYQQNRKAVTALVEECCTPTDVDVDTSAVASILIGIVDGLMLQWLLEPEAAMSGGELLRSVENAMHLVSGEQI